ncbi:MAG: peptide ABC transporter substrate-binding protein [Thermomicrobiales bacterium]
MNERQDRDVLRALQLLDLDRRAFLIRMIQGAAGAGALAADLPLLGHGTALAGPSMRAANRIAANQEMKLPEDAAPLDQQIWRVASDPTNAKVLDFYEAVYERPAGNGLFSEPLVRLDKNFQILPAAATEWSGSEDGTVWTFKLDQNLVWSDDTPLTARDYVRTFQYSADPEHAWDFTWFWRPVIRGYADAVDGKIPPEEISVKQGANEFEVVFETLDPAPYLPAMLLYSQPLSAAALETHGPLYNSNPETCVSCGPFILQEWARDQHLIIVRNEKYSGQLQIPMQKFVITLAAPNTHFTLYETGEIDFMENPAPAELQLMQADPEKATEVYQGVGDFGCFYFFFDLTKPPFDNKLVRQAFSHVVDRDAIIEQIMGPQGKVAYSFLAPGFPAANGEDLKEIQAFDSETARTLLAEAGYPDGEGFPRLTLQARGGGGPAEMAVVNAYPTMLKEHLNINVEVQVMDRQAFYDAMNAKPTEVQFGWVSYGMDYLDPSNMLGVWLSGGRHPWSNPDYDAKVKEATIFLGSEEDRIAMFQEAERLLVEDVPAVFTYFSTPIQLIKPYVKGDALAPDNNGIAAIHWPGFGTTSMVPAGLYISKDAPPNRQ